MFGNRNAALVVAAALAAVQLSACGGDGAKGESEQPAPARDAFTVRVVEAPELLSAYATVEAVDAVQARAQIPGTVTRLLVDEGAIVRRGQTLAIVSNETLSPQAEAASEQATAVRAQLEQAEADLARYEALFEKGYYPAQRLEAARAGVRSLRAQSAAASAGRSVVMETAAQGRVLAPADGKVLQVPVTQGAVLMPGESVAVIGSTYVLKLRLPQRHAEVLDVGDAVLVEDEAGERTEGRVQKVYPALADGRVVADVAYPGLARQAYGRRVRVWTPGQAGRALVIPASYVRTRYGVDFVRVLKRDGEVEEVVVRLGERRAVEGVREGVEVLAGLADGDRIVP